MEKNLLILGAGGYGFVAKEIAEAMGIFGKIDFLDREKPFAIGTFDDATRFLSEYSFAVVAVGDPELRSEQLSRLSTAGFTIPVLCHPRAYVSPSAKIAPGCIIEPLAVVNPNAVLQEGCLVSAGAVINHDAQVQRACHIDCGAVVKSGAVVPEKTKVVSRSVYPEL